MKHIFNIFLIIGFTNSSMAQLTKGHWLVGGNGSFYSYKNEIISSVPTINGKFNQIDISPNIGYFFADKFALGIRSTISSIKGKDIVVGGNGSGESSGQRYLIGIYGRFYFLEKKKQTNILADVSYKSGLIRGLNNTKGTLNTISFAAGPVIYFNSSIGIEFLFGYQASFEKYTS